MPYVFKTILNRHAHMIFDWARTSPLLKAIEKTVQPGDVVVDIGCGLGVLAFAACHAGARRVYAIDVDSEALAFARRQAQKLKMEKKIIWMEDHSFNIDLVEKADVLIQETIGPLAFDENFLPMLIDAKKRFLKKGGKIIPERVSLYGAPFENREKLLAKPARLKKISTKTAKESLIRIRKTWRVSRGARHFTKVLLWPHILWAKGCVTDCSPLKPPTHWGQTGLPTRKAGTTFRLFITPDPEDPLHYSEIRWQIF